MNITEIVFGLSILGFCWKKTDYVEDVPPYVDMKGLFKANQNKTIHILKWIHTMKTQECI